MALARYEGWTVDEFGDELASPTIQVNLESSGALAVLYSDRDGTTTLGNPFTGEVDGSFAFHVYGGAYRITITKGAFSKTLRYVARGTAAEYDVDDLSGLLLINGGIRLTVDTATADADPGTGKWRANSTTFASVTKLWIDNAQVGGGDISGWLDALDDGGASAHRSVLRLENLNDSEQWAEFNVTGSVVDKTGYRELTVTPRAQVGWPFTNASTSIVSQSRTGVVGPRETLVANRTYYVRTDGDDGNSGLINSAGGAFRTRQKAIDTVFNTLDTAGYTVNIASADGAYTDPVAIVGRPVGGGRINIYGNETTPENCTVTVDSDDCFRIDGNQNIFIYGFKLSTTTSGSCIHARYAAFILTSVLNFAAAAVSHYALENESTVLEFGTITISGGGVSRVHSTGGSAFYTTAARTYSGSPSFSAYIYGCAGGGTATVSGSASGTVTGKKGISHNFGIIDNSGGSTELEGSTDPEASDHGNVILKSTIGTTLGGSPLDALAPGGLQLNGGMEVSQQNGTTAVALASGTASYIVDQWDAKFVTASTLACSAQQVSTPTPPAGLQFGLQLKATTGLTPLGNGDYAYLSQPIKGYRVSKLPFGASSTNSISIGFWVYATIAGTMAVAITNSANNRSYVRDVVINSATTWEFKTVTIPIDTSGTWLKTTGIGLRVIFCFGAGSTFQTTAGAWAAGQYFATSSTTNFMATTNNICVVSGVLIMPGIQLPSSESLARLLRPFDDELALCQHYWCKSMRYATAPANGVGASTDGILSSGGAVDTTSIYGPAIPFPVPMRVVPTMTWYRTSINGTGDGTWDYFLAGWQDATSVSLNSATETNFAPVITKAAAFTANSSYGFAGAWAASARL